MSRGCFKIPSKRKRSQEEKRSFCAMRGGFETASRLCLAMLTAAAVFFVQCAQQVAGTASEGEAKVACAKGTVVDKGGDAVHNATVRL